MLPSCLLSLLLVVLASVAVAQDQPAPSAANRSPVFESQVRPILKTHCFPCHGEEDKHEAKLDLRLVRSMTRGGESGSAVVAGKHAVSLLWRRVAADEMPPGDKKLNPQERRLIADWIDAGAKTARPEPEMISDDEVTEEERLFWSFQPIKRPVVPEISDIKSQISDLKFQISNFRSQI